MHILGIGSFRLVFCMSKETTSNYRLCLLLVCLYNTVHLLLETKVYLNCPIKISALLCFDLWSFSLSVAGLRLVHFGWLAISFTLLLCRQHCSSVGKGLMMKMLH